MRKEEELLTPVDGDTVLLQVNILCSFCGKFPKSGGAAVMPVSLLGNSEEHLALLCSSCQNDVDASMDRISMSPPPRVKIVGSSLSKMSILTHAPGTAAFFEDALSAGRNGRGYGPEACLFNDKAAPKRTGETKYKLDYKKFTTEAGMSRGFPARLLPKPFDTLTNWHKKRSKKGTDSRVTEKRVIASEFSIRAQFLQQDFCYDSTLVVQPGQNGKYDVMDIRPVLREHEASIPFSVSKETPFGKRSQTQTEHFSAQDV